MRIQKTSEIARSAFRATAFALGTLLLLAGCPFAGPTAGFTAAPTEGDAPLTVSFVDQSLNGGADITSWLWDFGDGAQSVAQSPTHTYTRNGIYRVSLRVSSNNGTSTETKDDFIIVRAVPAAAFSATPRTGNAPLRVQFRDESTAEPFEIATWRWTFGDGEASTEQHPTHTYEQPGEYNVSLTVTSDGGAHAVTQTGFITVARLPQVSFTASPTRGPAPLAVAFTDTTAPGSAPIGRWTWVFGDGNTSTEQSPTHEYARPGVYSVSLTVRTAAGEITDTRNNLVTVTQTPVAAFSGTPTSGGVPLAVRFTDESEPGTANITGWLWDFGDGTSSIQQNPIHQFNEAGVFDISLTVTTADGTHTRVRPAYITAQDRPVAGFRASVRRGTVPLTVEFTDDSRAGASPITGRQWNFGDATVSGGVNPVHTYTAPGVYTVSLLVQSAVGSDVKVEPAYIEVVATPDADFTATPTLGESPLAVSFSDTSLPGTSPIVEWLWDFGDGTTGGEQNPTRIYTNPGIYTVSLTVTTAEGSDTETRAEYIRVRQRPNAAFTADVTAGNAPLSVQFRDTSTRGTETITGRTWDFGDGSTSTAEAPLHTYTAPGIYTVNLNLATSSGPESERKANFIRVDPAVSFTAAPATGRAPAFVTFTDTTDLGSLTLSGRTWDFGDGQTGDAANPIHQYTAPGVYDVSLTLDTEQGEAARVVAGAVRLRPTPAFTATPRAGVGESVAVQFEDLTDPGSLAINGWSWNFGDGTHSTQQNPAHTFAKPGVYAVSLTVITDIGNSITAESAYIAIRPEAAFAADVTEGTASLAVKFSDQTVPGNLSVLGWQWDFGDGATSTLRHPSHSYAAAGTYTVRLTVTSSLGTDSETKAGYIKVAPRVRFTGSSLSGVAPLDVTFMDITDPGTLEITKRVWDLGEGDPAEEDGPSYTYATPGLYDVSLTVTTSQGETTRVEPGFIAVLPVISATADVTPGTGSALAVFTNQTDLGLFAGATWLWNFGDGNTSTQASPTHNFTAPGVFDVTLTLITAGGVTETATVATIEVDPVASFSSDVTGGTAPLTVQFTDTSVAGNLDSSTWSWSWDFGDGNTSTSRNPQHTYTAAGTYAVSLTISTELGDFTATTPDAIGVIPAPDFTGAPLSGAPPLAVTFTDGTDLAGATLNSVLWNFGDGNTSANAMPTHNYATPGAYTVSLTVNTSEGSATETKVGYVQVDPIPSFTANATGGTAPFTVNFTDTSTLGSVVPTGYGWTFGDGGTSADQNPSHTYTIPGVYTVSMTLTSAQGQVTATETDFIAVTPEVTFSAAPASGPAPLMVTLTDTTAIGGLTVSDWMWDFGDGSPTVTTQTNSRAHTYTTPGNYTPTLTLVTSGGNATGSLGAPVQVNPVPSFSADITSGPATLTVTFTDNTALGNVTVTGREWNFGDGATASTANAAISHTYTAPGTYDVTMTLVTSTQGNLATTETGLITSHPINFSGDATNQIPSLTVNFTDNTNPGDVTITNRFWNFRDGATDNTAGNTVSHTYTEAGLYDVMLTITTSQGLMATGAISSDILVRPEVKFAATSAVLGPAPHNVTFQDQTATGNLTGITRHWIWGDGMASDVAGVNANHTYATAGCFDATLQLLTDQGTFSNIGAAVRVTVEDVATFTPPTTGNNAQAGIMFDLVALKDLRVDAFIINFTGTSGQSNTIRSYWSPFSSVGIETQPAFWLLFGNTAVTSGTGVLVNPPDIAMNSGNRFGFYLLNSSAGVTGNSISYQSASATGDFNDGNIRLITNAGRGLGTVNDFDGSIFSPRWFVGSIRYIHELTCNLKGGGLAVMANAHAVSIGAPGPTDKGVYPTVEDEVPAAVTPDGGRVALGQYSASGMVGEGPLLIRADENLELLWELDLAGFAFDRVRNIQVLAGGDLLLSGESSLNGTPGETLLVRLDAWGDFLWQQVLDGVRFDAVRATANGGNGDLLILAAHESPAGFVPVLYAVDEFSNILWAAELPPVAHDSGWGVFDRGGSLHVYGSTTPAPDDTAIWMVDLNLDGTAIGPKT